MAVPVERLPHWTHRTPGCSSSNLFFPEESEGGDRQWVVKAWKLFPPSSFGFLPWLKHFPVVIRLCTPTPATATATTMALVLTLLNHHIVPCVGSCRSDANHNDYDDDNDDADAKFVWGFLSVYAVILGENLEPRGWRKWPRQIHTKLPSRIPAH